MWVGYEGIVWTGWLTWWVIRRHSGAQHYVKWKKEVSLHLFATFYRPPLLFSIRYYRRVVFSVQSDVHHGTQNVAWLLEKAIWVLGHVLYFLFPFTLIAVSLVVTFWSRVTILWCPHVLWWCLGEDACMKMSSCTVSVHSMSGSGTWWCDSGFWIFIGRFFFFFFWCLSMHLISK